MKVSKGAKIRNQDQEGFSFKVRFFFTFLQGSLDPQNYELAPQIPEKNTSAPQLPENEKPFSPDPQNPWGPENVFGSFMGFFLSCVCYVFVRVCLYVMYVLCGHLLRKGEPLGSRLWCPTVNMSLSHWYPGSGVVLDCLDS